MTKYDWKLIDTWRHDLGYSYKHIRNLCVIEFGKAPSKGTLAYHYGEGQKQKTANRRKQLRSTDFGKFLNKVSSFKNKKSKSNYSPSLVMSPLDRFRNKVKNFKRKGKKNGWKMDVQNNYDTRDVIDRLWPNGISACGNKFPFIKCYLTGELVNVTDTDTHLDHIDPTKGNELDNIGVTQKYANQMKSDMSVDELVQMCKKIINHLERPIS